MSTSISNNGLAGTLFGKTRLAVLSLLFTRPDEVFYLREIARMTGVAAGAVQRELVQLSEAGIVRRTVRGRQAYYQADSHCPVFEELKGIVIKTAGLADVLRAALAPLVERIRLAWVFGSLARARQHRASDVDILVVGDLSFAEVVSALQPAQLSLGRELNPIVYSPREFSVKLAAGHAFLSRITSSERIVLIGDEHELERLAAKRLAR